MTRYSKALVAGLAFLLAALKVVSDGLGDATVSSQEAVAAMVAGLTALGVYMVPNVPPVGQSSDPNVSEVDRDAGYGEVTLLVMGAVLVLVVLLVAGRL